MLTTLFITIPITLIIVLIRVLIKLIKYSIKVTKTAVSTASDVYSTTKTGVKKVKSGTNKAVGAVKNIAVGDTHDIERGIRKFGKGAVGLASRLTATGSRVARAGSRVAAEGAIAFGKVVLKLIVKFVTCIVGLISIPVAIVCLCLVLGVAILASTITSGTISSGNTGATLSYAQKPQQKSTLDLSSISLEKLNYNLKPISKRSNGLTTKVKRVDFERIAKMICTEGSATKTYNKRSASKYIGYYYGGFHGYFRYCDRDKYINKLGSQKLTQSAINDFSTRENRMPVGVYTESEKTIFTDCSGFAAWIYGTAFRSIDASNPDIDTLANWFCYCSSGSDYTGAMNCKEVKFCDIKAGDILVRKNGEVDGEGGHVGVAISNTEYAHASCQHLGIYIASIKDSDFKHAYRPNIKFADD